MGMSIDEFDKFLREDDRRSGPSWSRTTPEMKVRLMREDKLAIIEVVQNWALWRDAGDWERFRTVWHDDGWMTATWFQGPAAEFIKVSKAGFEKGVSILHFLGGSSVDVKGSRAVAQTKMTINQRGDCRRRKWSTWCAPAASMISSKNAKRQDGPSCGASRSTKRTAWTR